MEHWTCDGHGHGVGVSRRSLLAGGIVLGASLFGTTPARAQARFTPRSKPFKGKTLVVVFLRGGADGLNLLVPYAEPEYYRLRPTIAIAAPNDRRQSQRQRGIKVDDRFAFHPALGAWREAWDAGNLAAVPACGSLDESRSHFEAMATMERGVARASEGPQDGWVGRYLSETDADGALLRAMAFSSTTPDSLRGAPAATTVESLDVLKLNGSPRFKRMLEQHYAKGTDAASLAGREALRLLDRLASTPRESRPGYPNTSLGLALSQTATLIRAQVGLEIVLLEHGGWDTHVGQGGSEGWQASLAKELADATAAFYRDLKPMHDVLLLAVSEFGRRSYENSGYGTDHGRGGVLWSLGGPTRGGVHGPWPGLSEASLEGPGDVPVATDYRSVMSSSLKSHLGVDPAGVFGPTAPFPSIFAG